MHIMNTLTDTYCFQNGDFQLDLSRIWDSVLLRYQQEAGYRYEQDVK